MAKDYRERKTTQCSVELGVEDGPDGSFSSRKYFAKLTSLEDPDEQFTVCLPINQYQALLDRSHGVVRATVSTRDGDGMSRLEIIITIRENK
ncbi:MAG: hypothetical protein KKD17_05465 [Nanoarchaeota archaeon]|nr:hypothetical protein [Nanoarchaeota archaeon]